jgi:nitroimidazol reductase NimA-like FMN-containing flavoprotein (pyridoxamine 5'-phosphate oxidase superfamily)
MSYYNKGDTVTELLKTDRSTVRRLRQRAVYRRVDVDGILDEALVCHVGFVVDGTPHVLPTLHARSGDVLYLHGAPANQMLGTARQGVEICVTVTLIDGLVLARSAFHHSVNYRSVTLFGRASEVVDQDEKRRALAILVDHVVPGRNADARPPSESELRSTLVLRLDIQEGSAKVRTGPPVDDAEDLVLPVWAGVIPLALVTETPMPSPDMDASVPMPAYVSADSRWLREPRWSVRSK